MKVCISCVEFFSWGKYGGFGRASRLVGSELVKRGVEVCAIVPRQKSQKPIEDVDGMKVYSFPKNQFWQSWSLFKQVDADIYHSSEPSLGTYIAMKAMPDRKHIVNFQDARNFKDWKQEYDLPSVNKLQVLSNYFYEHHFLAGVAVRRAHGVFSQSESQIPKIQDMYNVPKVLPLHNPVTIPAQIKKADRPTIGWLNRWDRRKRPELFLGLAEKFPDVHFIAGGASRDKEWDSYLRDKYSRFPNLEMVGFVDQFSNRELHTRILEESWIMVNTATREALPTNAFIEAAAHQCAILAGLDYQDGFADNFGYCALNQDFEEGVRWLLENDRWRERGQKGQAHVRDEYRTDLVIDQHLRIYERALQGKGPRLNGTQINPLPEEPMVEKQYASV